MRKKKRRSRKCAEKIVLPVPQNVYAEAAGANDILVAWREAEGAEEYFVERSRTESGPYTRLGTVRGLEYYDTGLMPDTEYFYRVSAGRAGKKGKPGIVAATATWPEKPELTAPAGLSARAVDDERISVTWEEVERAEGYYIYRSEKAEDYYPLVGLSETKEYVDVGLSPDTLYYYKAAAYFHGLRGPMSGAASAATDK